MNIIKRNGLEEGFNSSKIIAAVSKANDTVPDDVKLTRHQMDVIADRVELRYQNMPDVPTIEEIQDFVEMGIMQCAAYEVAQHYMAYRYEHKKLRQLTNMDSNVLSLTENNNLGKCRQKEFSDKVAYDIAWRHLLPGFISEAQEDGLLYFHGASHFAESMICDSYIDLGKVFNKGCFISGGIQKPDNFVDACRVTAYVIVHAFDIQYGNLAFSIAPLAAFLRAQGNEAGKDSETLQKELSFGVRLLRDIINIETNEKGHKISTVINLNDADEENDRQSFIMMTEEFLNQEAADKQKNMSYIPNRYIYILTDDNNANGSNYWHLTETVMNITNIHPFIDLISEKQIANSQTHKGWFSQGKATINLVDVALSAGGDTKKFWDILDKRLTTCHLALKTWHDRLLGVSSNSSSIMWQNGGLDVLDCDKPIDNVLCDSSHSSLLLGIAGMNETCMVIRKEGCNGEKGMKFAVKIIKHINDRLEEWTISDNIGYKIAETYDCDTVTAFTEALKVRFGEVPGITDKGYITGGVRGAAANDDDVSEALARCKLIQEQIPVHSMYQLDSEVLCNGDNSNAIIKEIYDMGISVTFDNKADKCTDCGYEGRMNIVTDKKTGILGWICPECGNTDTNRMIIQRKRASFTEQGQTLSQCELAELRENDN